MGFDNSFEDDELNYGDVFDNTDSDGKKEKIIEWVESHCVCCQSVDSRENSTDNKPKEGVDFVIGTGFEINILHHVNVYNLDAGIPDFIRFGTVGDDFYVMGQKIKNTNGFPKEIGTNGIGNLWMFDNEISEITDFPEVIHGNCCVRKNKLTNLNGLPTMIDNVLDVSDNDPDFKFERTDGKICHIGKNFFGTVSDQKINETSDDTASNYKDVTGDKTKGSRVLAMALAQGGNPVVSTQKKFICYSHGDV